MNHKGTVKLETDRLILRRFVIEDADDMFINWANDDEVTKFLTWPTHTSVDVSKEILSDWIERYEKNDFYNWAIELKETGHVIGNISVVHMNDDIDCVTIGYCMSRQLWGQRIMPEALGEVIAFMFDEVEANRVEAYHDSNNPKSGRVMAKAGMKYEGTIRQADRNNQGIVDMVMYSVLKDEV